MKSKDILQTVVEALVENPHAVNVTESADDMGILLALDVHPDDMGKVIGRAGATAKALRTILRVVGMTENARVSLKINEPEGSTRPARSDKDILGEE